MLAASTEAWAQGEAAVSVTITPAEPGLVIPQDFVGMSFGMKTLPANKEAGHFFSATNAPLITLFRNMGVKHLRVGGTTVDSPPVTPIPNNADIDSLFAFVRAAGVGKVIYSLRLLETDPARHYAATDAAIAKHIWDHYQSYLDSFAIGNEPNRRQIYGQDLAITNLSSYLIKWRTFAIAITNAAPGSKFSGPDAGSGEINWTIRFAEAEKDLLAVVTEHFYVGGAGRGVPAAQGLEDMLSPSWIEANEALYKKMAEPVTAMGLPYRFTEANDHYSGGIRDASDTFAGALWALDFLHWWAAHGAAGVDFHNTTWVANDVITTDPDGGLAITPKGYGIKAFDLGGHGRIERLSISNPDQVNITAYAVADTTRHFVTLINKEHGPQGREAAVTIIGTRPAPQIEVICLTAPNGDIAARSGVTLGGASINNHQPWHGKWETMKLDKPGRCVLKIPAASAIVVKLPR